MIWIQYSTFESWWNMLLFLLYPPNSRLKFSCIDGSFHMEWVRFQDPHSIYLSFHSPLHHRYVLHPATKCDILMKKRCLTKIPSLPRLAGKGTISLVSLGMGKKELNPVEKYRRNQKKQVGGGSLEWSIGLRASGERTKAAQKGARKKAGRG